MTTYNKNTSGAWAWAISLGVLAIIGAVGTAVSNTERTATIMETLPIPYETTYVEDATLEYGKTKTQTTGVAGTRTLTYKVKTKGGKEVERELTKSEVTTQPINEVVARGTRPAWHCHDTTSYDRNPYNDNYCEYSDGTGQYAPDSEARALDPSYTPGTAGAAYYNSF